MQYKIPQDISTEDKLVAFLSLRQLIIVGVGGGIAYMMYISLVRVADPIVYIPPMFVIIVLTLAVAFFKKDNLTFTRMILLVLESLINPMKRFWVPFAGDVSPFQIIETLAQADSQAQQKTVQPTEKHIEDINQLVRLMDYNSNDEIRREQMEHAAEYAAEGDTKRMSFIEQVSREAAQRVTAGMRKPMDRPDELDENRFIKQETIV